MSQNSMVSEVREKLRNKVDMVRKRWKRQHNGSIMNPRRTLAALSTGVIVGFSVGCVVSVKYTIANRYLQYRLFRLTVLTLREALNKWVISGVIVSLAITIVLFALSRIRQCSHPPKPPCTLRLSEVSGKLASALVALLLVLNAGLLIDGKINYPLDQSNVVLISIDTLRPDHLGCYGYSRNTSPNIDMLAKGSVLFRNAITPRPKTTPSMVSMLTGLYPHTHGVRTLIGQWKYEVVTLQEILRNNNYKTAAFVGNWVLKKRCSGLHQGFEVYDDRMPDKEMNREIYQRNAPDINEAVFRWLEKHRDERFFLWIHYQDVHGPYTAPDEYQELFTHTDEDLIPADFVPDYQRLPWVIAKGKFR